MDSARYKVEDGRKEELCDQIFRLFRYYAPEIRRERIRMDNPDIDVDAIPRRFVVTPDFPGAWMGCTGKGGNDFSAVEAQESICAVA